MRARRLRARRATAALAALLSAAPAAAGEAPGRVVSINLCTDQLAALLAAPGQLVSVTEWAHAPRASMVVDLVRGLPANGGSAEEVYRAAPDLVLAGTFSDRASVDLLRRLGVRVEEFAPVTRLDAIAPELRRMGALLGREALAERIAAEVEAALAAAAADAAAAPEAAAPEAAVYYANSYTAGRGTLEDDLLAAAGFANLARRLDLASVARVPLEALVVERPFLVETTRITEGEGGRAYETLSHPALAAVRARAGGAAIDGRPLACGGLHALETLAALRAAQAGVRPEKR